MTTFGRSVVLLFLVAATVADALPRSDAKLDEVLSLLSKYAGRQQSKTSNHPQNKVLEEARVLKTRLFDKYQKAKLMLSAMERSGYDFWTYDVAKESGPYGWSVNYPACGNSLQSPINILTTEAVVQDYFSDFHYIGYDEAPEHKMSVTNNGHTIEVEVEAEAKIKGGGLDSTYTLEQIHFHWGRTNEEGSEHTLDGRASPLEIHMVHWNSASYGSFSEAKIENDGLAVLGIFVEVGTPGEVELNRHLGELALGIQQVSQPGAKTTVKPFSFDSILPSSRTFFRYKGSLTTPPCFESVTWTVFEQPIYITQEQMDAFHQVFLSGGRGANFRPVQATNGRFVLMSPALK